MNRSAIDRAPVRPGLRSTQRSWLVGQTLRGICWVATAGAALSRSGCSASGARWLELWGVVGAVGLVVEIARYSAACRLTLVVDMKIPPWWRIPVIVNRDDPLAPSSNPALPCGQVNDNDLGIRIVVEQCRPHPPRLPRYPRDLRRGHRLGPPRRRGRSLIP